MLSFLVITITPNNKSAFTAMSGSDLFLLAQKKRLPFPVISCFGFCELFIVSKLDVEVVPCNQHVHIYSSDDALRTIFLILLST